MKEITVRYLNGPLQGVGLITVPDDAADEPPLIQRIPVPNTEGGFQRTMTATFGSGSHAVYERSALNANHEWEFQLVRIE